MQSTLVLHPPPSGLRQVPASQRLPPLQVAQIAPPSPQEVSEGIRQVVPVQQPDAQLAGLQDPPVQTPFVQVCPALQVMQAVPFAPHAEVDVPGWHEDPAQQPAQDVEQVWAQRGLELGYGYAVVGFVALSMTDRAMPAQFSASRKSGNAGADWCVSSYCFGDQGVVVLSHSRHVCRV